MGKQKLKNTHCTLFDGGGGEVGASWLENASMGERPPLPPSPVAGRRAGHAPHQLQHSGDLARYFPWAITLQLTLLAGMWVCQSNVMSVRETAPLMACPATAQVREASSLPFAAHHLQQVGELAPGSQEWECRPCTLPGHHSRASLLDMITRQLVPCTSCSTLENGPHIWPGKHSRAGP